MRPLLKTLFYLAIAGVVWLLFWFLPKYSFVSKNPGYCAQLTTHLYYCGTESQLDQLFGQDQSR